MRHLKRFGGIVLLGVCAWFSADGTQAQEKVSAQPATIRLPDDSAYPLGGTKVSTTMKGPSSANSEQAPSPEFYNAMMERLNAAENRIRELESRKANFEKSETSAEFLLTQSPEEKKEALLEAGKDKEKGNDDKMTGSSAKEKKWYDRISLRGYTQIRMNETIIEKNGGGVAQSPGDASIGDSKNFIIRRARLILFGDITDHLGIYLQPDFAASVPGITDAFEFTQLRDWYADIFVDRTKVHRFRVGQSKIPYGWENLQSSQNRLALDRNDAINSAARNERDIGVFYYFTPEDRQEIFRFLIEKNLKGSGNYGIFGIGVYNGQGGALQEQNNNLHAIARVAYPFVLDNGQIVEFGAQAFTGRYTVLSSTIRANGRGASIRPLNTLENNGKQGIRDERVAVTAVYYPQPFGFQAEWTVGTGPSLTPDQRRVEERALQGGYIQTMYKYDIEENAWVIPFVKWNYFRGGYRSERNAPYAKINEWEFGVEYCPRKELEFTLMYTVTDRTNTTAIDQVGVTPYQQFKGHLLRMQLQFNY